VSIIMFEGCRPMGTRSTAAKEVSQMESEVPLAADYRIVPAN
jgi:hypothetical protein